MSEGTTLRLVIAGGGTGGHTGPAVAVLAALRERGPVEATWIGGTWGIERDRARAAGVPFVAIQTGKLRRYLSWHTPVDAARIPLGVGQAWRALRRLRPQVIFSTGGYVAAPTAFAAARLGIPVVMHEQTAQIGLANRLIARYANILALSFPVVPDGATVGKARVLLTGNPVRKEIFGGDAARGAAHFGLSPDLPTIYATGGARGSSPVNHLIEDALPKLLPHAQIIHATGPIAANGDFPRLTRIADNLPESQRGRYVVREMIGEDLRDVYALASLIVGRSGAGTVAELAALGKPSLLIPLPGTGGDEATKNARILADAGGAEVRPQAGLTSDALAEDILRLLKDPAALARMGDAARTIAPHDAADRLADAILHLVERSTP